MKDPHLMATKLIKTASQRRTQQAKLRRKLRIRAKIQGTPARPRISLFKSAQHIYVQIIDDNRSHTLLSLSSFQAGQAGNRDKSTATQSSRAGIDTCAQLGTQLAARCLEAGITEVVFDRGGLPFHGRIKAFADAARAAGLKF